jgi:hypothetical protein
MKMTFTKSAFEMPDGKYMARFEGTTERAATGQLDQRGNPMPPGMTWDFTIVEPGENNGKKTDRLTGRQPTAKSGCGKFLAAITDSVLRDGQEVDLSQYVGKYYRVTVQENRVSDNPAPVLVPGYNPASMPTLPSSTQPATQTRPATPPPPPSRPPVPPPAPAASVEPKFWIDLGNGKIHETALSFEETKSELFARGLNADAVNVCVDGTNEWKLASTFGLNAPF